jgi:hypothetical protein
MAPKSDEPKNLQSPPECICQLHARWVSTLTYQAIRDGISDYLAPASSTRRGRTSRKRFSSDGKYLALTDNHHSFKGDQTQKTQESTSKQECYQRLPLYQSIRLLRLRPKQSYRSNFVDVFLDRSAFLRNAVILLGNHGLILYHM